MASRLVPTFCRWDGGTLNTPYKSGITQAAEGFAICFGDPSTYMTIAAWTKGGAGYYIGYHINGVFKGWDRYALNSESGKAKYVSDLMGAQDVPTFVQWTADTTNTPYKAGKTSSSHGFAIVYGNYGGNQVIFAMAMGSSTIFVHRCSNGTPSGWESK